MYAPSKEVKMTVFYIFNTPPKRRILQASAAIEEKGYLKTTMKYNALCIHVSELNANIDECGMISTPRTMPILSSHCIF